MRLDLNAGVEHFTPCLADLQPPLPVPTCAHQLRRRLNDALKPRHLEGIARHQETLDRGQKCIDRLVLLGLGNGKRGGDGIGRLGGHGSVSAFLRRCQEVGGRRLHGSHGRQGHGFGALSAPRRGRADLVDPTAGRGPLVGAWRRLGYSTASFLRSEGGTRFYAILRAGRRRRSAAAGARRSSAASTACCTKRRPEGGHRGRRIQASVPSSSARGARRARRRRRSCVGEQARFREPRRRRGSGPARRSAASRGVDGGLRAHGATGGPRGAALAAAAIADAPGAARAAASGGGKAGHFRVRFRLGRNRQAPRGRSGRRSVRRQAAAPSRGQAGGRAGPARGAGRARGGRRRRTRAGAARPGARAGQRREHLI